MFSTYRSLLNKVGNCCWSISYLDYCCCFSTKAVPPKRRKKLTLQPKNQHCRQRLSDVTTSTSPANSQGMPTLRRRTAEPSTSLRPTSSHASPSPGPHHGCTAAANVSSWLHPAPVAALAVAVGASQRQTVAVGPSRPTGPLGPTSHPRAYTRSPPCPLPRILTGTRCARRCSS